MLQPLGLPTPLRMLEGAPGGPAPGERGGAMHPRADTKVGVYLAAVFPEGFGQDVCGQVGLHHAGGGHGGQQVRPWGTPKHVPSGPSAESPQAQPPVACLRPSPHAPIPAGISPGAENSSIGTLLVIMSRLHFSGSPPCRIMSTISLTQVVPGESNPPGGRPGRHWGSQHQQPAGPWPGTMGAKGNPTRL